ncbi:hypothetical protein J6A31_05805 [bacterium]|nr:hypothetical protein [bacterium]
MQNRCCSNCLHKNVCNENRRRNHTVSKSVCKYYIQTFTTSSEHLPIAINLNENTRKQGVNIKGKIYALHIVDANVIVTDNDDYTKIYSIQTKDFFDKIEEVD